MEIVGEGYLVCFGLILKSQFLAIGAETISGRARWASIENWQKR
jgi:hypothetical protein